MDGRCLYWGVVAYSSGTSCTLKASTCQGSFISVCIKWAMAKHNDMFSPLQFKDDLYVVQVSTYSTYFWPGLEALTYYLAVPVFTHYNGTVSRWKVKHDLRIWPPRKLSFHRGPWPRFDWPSEGSNLHHCRVGPLCLLFFEPWKFCSWLTCVKALWWYRNIAELWIWF